MSFWLVGHPYDSVKHIDVCLVSLTHSLPPLSLQQRRNTPLSRSQRVTVRKMNIIEEAEVQLLQNKAPVNLCTIEIKSIFFQTMSRKKGFRFYEQLCSMVQNTPMHQYITKPGVGMFKPTKNSLIVMLMSPIQVINAISCRFNCNISLHNSEYE